MAESHVQMVTVVSSNDGCVMDMWTAPMHQTRIIAKVCFSS